MTSYSHISRGETRRAMHGILDNAGCAVMLYLDDDGQVRIAAAASPGLEGCVMDCLTAAAARTREAVCGIFDTPRAWEGGAA